MQNIQKHYLLSKRLKLRYSTHRQEHFSQATRFKVPSSLRCLYSIEFLVVAAISI